MIEKWKKNLIRKAAPFYLYAVRDNFEYFYLPAREKRVGNQYMLLWYDKYKDKVKYGSLHDGMHTRYGIATYGTLSGNSISGIWQCTAGVLTDEVIKAMIAFGDGTCTWPVFDLNTLKDLQI